MGGLWPGSALQLIRGSVLSVLALVVFWRAPQFVIVALAFGYVAIKDWMHLYRIYQEANAPQPIAKRGLPEVLVSRKARELGGTAWSNVRSWLGGAPRLGGVPWPRSEKDGKPLVFLGQIDLAEVAAKIGPSPLPSTGALAFFVGDRPVVYVSASESTAFTPVPADAPTLEDAGYSGIGVVTWPDDPLGPRSFPFWPVDLTVVPGEVPCRNGSFTARQAYAAAGGDEAEPVWWHSAIALADCLRIAATFRVPHKVRVQRQAGTAVAAFEGGIPVFEEFAAEVAAWVRGRDPWEILAAPDVKQFSAYFERASGEFKEYTRFSVPHSLDALYTGTLIALATAEERAYATMPARIRQLINAEYLLPVGSAHQMFGAVIDIQGGAAEEAESNYLLLRLNHDDMMHWGFGDAGAYHFFLSPDDLAKRNFAAARMTFECG